MMTECDHSELYRTIRELQSENKALKKADKHREKLWKSRIEELEKLNDICRKNMAEDAERIEELEARIDELPDDDDVADLQFTIRNLVAKLEAWCDYYVNGSHPDDVQNLYTDTQCLLEQSDE